MLPSGRRQARTGDLYRVSAGASPDDFLRRRNDPTGKEIGEKGADSVPQVFHSGATRCILGAVGGISTIGDRQWESDH